MNCKKCGQELTGGESICPNCGEILGAAAGKKKSKKLLVVFLIILILAALVGAGAFYYYMQTTPKAIFTKAINNMFSEMETSLDIMNVAKQKADMELSADIDTDVEELEQIAEIVNDVSIKINAQQDTENKKYVLGVDVEYDKETMIDAKAHVDLKEEKLYLHVEDLFEKYFELDISGEDISEITTTLEEGQIKNAKKALEITEEVINSNLKDEYFTKSTEKINISDKEENVNKSTLTMNGSQFIAMLKNIVTNLKDNEEFLNCYNDKDLIKESLEEVIEEIEDSEDEELEELTIAMSIYTKGLLNEFAKFEIKIVVDEEEAKVEVAKKSEEEYNIKISIPDSEPIEATYVIKVINENEEEATLKLKIDEIGTIAVKIKAKVALNEDVDKVDEDDTVKVEELTEAQMQEIQKNLTKMPIYQLISMYSGQFNTEDTTTSVDTTIVPEFTFETDDEEETTNNTQAEDTTTSNPTVSNNTTGNFLKTYDNEIVEFKVPTGYEYLSEYSSTSDNPTYRYFKKGDIRVTAKIRYTTVEEYEKSLESTKTSYEKSYKNVTLSKANDMTVNGKVFNIYDFKYDYVSTYSTRNYVYKYATYKVDEDNLYVVEIENSKEMTENELKEFLTITVK